jgi:hypothetical protein
MLNKHAAKIRMDFFNGHVKRHPQNFFPLSAKQGQNPVRRQGFNLFLKIVIHFKFGFLFLELFLDATDHESVDSGYFPQMLADFGIVRKLFRQNIHGALKRLLRRFVSFFNIHEPGRMFDRKPGGFGAFNEPRRQRFKPRFLCLDGPGCPFWFKRQIQVFDFGFGEGVGYFRFKLGRKLPLFANAIENGLTPFIEFLVIFAAVLKIADLIFVKAAGHFLAVPGDKRNRPSLIEQGKGIEHLKRLHIEFFDQLFGNIHGCALRLNSKIKGF